MIKLLCSVAPPVPLPAARAPRSRNPSKGVAAAVFFTVGCSDTTDEPVPPALPSLSFEEAVAGRTELTVYEVAQDLAARAWADPGQDWTSELEQVTADPYRSDQLADLQSAGQGGTVAYRRDLTSTDAAVVDVDLAAGVNSVSERVADGPWLVAERAELDEPC